MDGSQVDRPFSCKNQHWRDTMKDGVQSLEDMYLNTANDAIKILIVIGLLALILVPIYIKATEKRRKQSIEREKILVDVIANNASASSRLATILENNNRACDSCKFEQTSLYQQLHNKVDQTDKKLTEIKFYIMGGNDNLNENKEGGHFNEKSGGDS